MFKKTALQYHFYHNNDIVASPPPPAFGDKLHKEGQKNRSHTNATLLLVIS